VETEVKKAHLPSQWLKDYVAKRGGVLDIGIHTLVAG
jgi:hypothetical protein